MRSTPTIAPSRLSYLAVLVAALLVAGAQDASAAKNGPAQSQTYLSTIGRPALFPALRPVKVAILDAGIDGAHPDLAGRIVGSHRFGAGDPLYPASPHGTATAGLIAAVDGNGFGIDGIAPNAYLLSANVSSVTGPDVFSEQAIGLGIRWAADHGARVVNLSLAGPGPDRQEQEAIAYAVRKGVLIVAAAGNCFGGDFARCTPDGTAQAPAWLPHVLAVGATSGDPLRPAPAPFSIPSERWVDLAAPGDLITTLWPIRNNPYYAVPGCAFLGTTACYSTGAGGPWGPSGTSFATAMVSAAAVILFGADPELRAEQVIRLLKETARPISPDPLHQTGAGMLDIAAALARVESGAIPAADYGEPNDDPDSATAIRPVRPVTATISWRDDPEDEYRVALRLSEKLVLRTTAKIPAAVALYPVGKRTPLVAARLGRSLTLRVTRAGVYRLVVTAARNAAGSYTLTRR